MKPFVPGPRIVNDSFGDKFVVYGPEFDGKKRKLVGTFTGDYKEGNALLDSLAPDLYAILKEILESEVEPPPSVWERARVLIDKIDMA
jgi:hypothetical protein